MKTYTTYTFTDDEIFTLANAVGYTVDHLPKDRKVPAERKEKEIEKLMNMYPVLQAALRIYHKESESK